MQLGKVSRVQTHFSDKTKTRLDQFLKSLCLSLAQPDADPGLGQLDQAVALAPGQPGAGAAAFGGGQHGDAVVVGLIAPGLWRALAFAGQRSFLIRVSLKCLNNDRNSFLGKTKHLSNF